MKGLIIKGKYVDLILQGSKRWEIRSRKTLVRGRIALIKSGSGKVFGEVDLIDCMEIDLDQYNNYCKNLYGVEREKLPYEKTYAWVLENPLVYDNPVDYSHPKGAIIWVNLEKN